MGVLLLAAGFSRRFGADKRAAVLINGESLLHATVRQIGAAQLPLRICLRVDDRQAEWLQALPFAAERIYCDRAERGMGATLAQGISACRDWSVTLVALGDMPWISTETLRHIAACANEERIVVPRFAHRRGHPVAFGSAFYEQLSQLDGDSGARALLNTASSSVRWVDVDDPGILRDVDRPADVL